MRRSPASRPFLCLCLLLLFWLLLCCPFVLPLFEPKPLLPRASHVLMHVPWLVPPDRSAQVLKERRPLRCHAATPGMRMFCAWKLVCITWGSPTIPLGPASMAGNCSPVALKQVWAGVAGIGGTCPGIFCFTASPRGTIRRILVVAECLPLSLSSQKRRRLV